MAYMDHRYAFEAHNKTDNGGTTTTCRLERGDGQSEGVLIVGGGLLVKHRSG